MTPERIHLRHLRAARLCSGGSREWCARNGFSWQQFITEGLPIEQMRALNDAMIDRVIAEAEKEAGDVSR